MAEIVSSKVAFAAQLDQLKSKVRQEPQDATHRVAYFQFLCVQGEWEKAVDQLALIEELDPAHVMFAQTYARAVRCEIERRRVHLGEGDPTIFGEPVEWLGLLVEAFRHLRDRNWEAATKARELAFEAAPPTPGLLNGQEIGWVADSDPRYGPVLESFIEGRYRWVPFQNLSRLQLTAPKHVIDLVWLPAKFTWTNGGSVDGLIPVRYFGSEKSSEEAVRRAETTHWEEVYTDCQLGSGHRLLCSDLDDTALAEVSTLELTQTDPK